MGFLSDEELAQLLPAEEAAFASPVPTQIVSSDEYFPEPQNARQREVEARLKEMGDTLAARQGISRRRFFQTASGMAAAFLAMNQVYGNLFAVSEAEAATPELADERAGALKPQTVFDAHTHFLRDDTHLTGFLAMRQAVGKAGWNPGLTGHEQTIDDLKFANYFKEIYLDSDTKVALLTNAPSDIPDDWFLTNEMVFATRAKVNRFAGSKRMLAHYTIVPGQPGWLEGVEHAIADLKPDGWKGYTIGDNTHKASSHYPWRLDDEKLMYPAYERMARSGVKNVCIHKGLFPPSVEKQVPDLRPYVDVSDVGPAAKDWPQLNFVVYHSGYRHVGGSPAEAMAEWDRTGRSSWVSDLAEIPAKYGVTNVYGDLGQLFAYSSVAEPRLAAALMGTLVKGLGSDHVIWGTDAVWTGSPQWQIEGLRRLEIPEDMQAKHGFAPLGPADGPVKQAILAKNGLRIFGYDEHAELATPDRFAAMKDEYEHRGAERSNLRYGYVRKAAG
ncbi:MAG: amidohydrolase family protein [Acidisphaera sp.]|nr:amidohydrolase family protein [Acidisphaera sp.]